jgi:hypothetical protein
VRLRERSHGTAASCDTCVIYVKYWLPPEPWGRSATIKIRTRRRGLVGTRCHRPSCLVFYAVPGGWSRLTSVSAFLPSPVAKYGTEGTRTMVAAGPVLTWKAFCKLLTITYYLCPTSRRLTRTVQRDVWLPRLAHILGADHRIKFNWCWIRWNRLIVPDEE